MQPPFHCHRTQTLIENWYTNAWQQCNSHSRTFWPLLTSQSTATQPHLDPSSTNAQHMLQHLSAPVKHLWIVTWALYTHTYCTLTIICSFHSHTTSIPPLVDCSSTSTEPQLTSHMTAARQLHTFCSTGVQRQVEHHLITSRLLLQCCMAAYQPLHICH